MIYDADNIPDGDVAIVLGTSKNTVLGDKNFYFDARIDAATTLYQQGKIRHLIVSGDNHTIHYNEPRDMYQALAKRGVPRDKITLDYAGFRTLDSIVRSKEIFGQDHIIIVTQRFHCYRALYIARFNGVNAMAYQAESPEETKWSIRLRELIARPLAIIDLYVLNTAPKFLGEPEPISL